MKNKLIKHIHLADVRLNAILVCNSEIKTTVKKKKITKVILFCKFSTRIIYLGMAFQTSSPTYNFAGEELMLSKIGSWDHYKYLEIFCKHINAIQMFTIMVVFNYGIYLNFFSYIFVLPSFSTSSFFSLENQAILLHLSIA